MYSSRLLLLIAIPMTTGRYLQCTTIKYDRKSKQFIYQPHLHYRVKLRFCILIFAILIKAYVTLQYKKQKRINDYNFSLAFLYAMVFCLILYGMTTFYEDKMAILLNATFSYFKQLQGNIYP